jgi:hypothetical protein
LKVMFIPQYMFPLLHGASVLRSIKLNRKLFLLVHEDQGHEENEMVMDVEWKQKLVAHDVKIGYFLTFKLVTPLVLR